jgi:hypothetical protein
MRAGESKRTAVVSAGFGCCLLAKEAIARLKQILTDPAAMMPGIRRRWSKMR